MRLHKPLHCWLGEHTDVVRYEPTRIYTQCLDCGRSTSGWIIDRTDFKRAEREAHERLQARARADVIARRLRGEPEQLIFKGATYVFNSAQWKAYGDVGRGQTSAG